MATRKQFEKELNKIGWKIANSHNGLNDWLINGQGKRTRIRCVGKKEPKIQIEAEKEIFGDRFNGSVVFLLSECNVETNEKLQSVNLFPKGTEQSSMSFYNFKD